MGNRTADIYAASLERGHRYVAESADAGVGYTEKEEMYAVFVDPKWTSRGIGKQLLLHRMEMIKQAGQDSIFLKSTLNAVGF